MSAHLLSPVALMPRYARYYAISQWRHTVIVRFFVVKRMSHAASGHTLWLPRYIDAAIMPMPAVIVVDVMLAAFYHTRCWRVTKRR